MKRKLLTAILGAFFIAAGANHFAHASFYVRIVPAWMPAHALMVQVSGVAEMLGGIGVLVLPLRRAAGAGLILLLIAVFPANVWMARHADLYRDIGSAAAFDLRLPLQVVLIAWVWWCCLRPTVQSRGPLARSE